METKKFRVLVWVFMTCLLMILLLPLAHVLQRDFGISLEAGSNAAGWYVYFSVMIYLCFALSIQKGAWWNVLLPLAVALGFSALIEVSHTAYLVAAAPAAVLVAFMEDWKSDLGAMGKCLVFLSCATGLVSIDIFAQYAEHVTPITAMLLVTPIASIFFFVGMKLREEGEKQE